MNVLDLDLLESAIGDEAWRVRRRAIELIARAGELVRADDGRPDDGVVEALIIRLDDDRCAEAAAFALGELGAPTPTIVEALERQATTHTDPLCRESAVAALGALGAGRITVLAALDDVTTIRRRAVIALANYDGDDIRLALERATADRDWQVRQAAEDLLGVD